VRLFKAKNKEFRRPTDFPKFKGHLKKEKTMNASKGIQTHGFFKLGKAPAKKDKRNFKMAALLKKIPKVPREWDFDTADNKYHIPLPMFGNDVYGDCVIAGRAHQTLRFEVVEQRKVIGMTEKDVLREYWKEEGGSGPNYDQGLVVLDSLNLWRKNGWKPSIAHTPFTPSHRSIRQTRLKSRPPSTS
jgi:hypothetical protein